MPKTLLAVDDSATMRKVLEITFVGEDFRVVTADSARRPRQIVRRARSLPHRYVLGSDDGYALSREIRKRDSPATIVLLSSRHNPYDPAKGKDAGADDFMDKPFDTQQMVEKVRKASQLRESGGAPASAAPAAATAPPPRSRPPRRRLLRLPVRLRPRRLPLPRRPPRPRQPSPRQPARTP